MPSPAPVNGASTSNGVPDSFAKQLESRHTNDHQVTMEEVEDEDDIQHPRIRPKVPASTDPQPTGDSQTLSAKAAGKQKMPLETGDAVQPPRKAPVSLDTTSEELFPSLGGGPKPRAPGAAPAAWGSRKASSLANGNGTTLNGGMMPSSPPSTATSRTSTPGPGNLTPTSPAPASATLPRSMASLRLPGKYSEKWPMSPAQLQPRAQLKKPIPELIRDINKKSPAVVNMKHMGDGGIEFEAVGPSLEVVQQALKDVSREVGIKHILKISVLGNTVASIIGKGGATINNIKRKSGAKIDVPKVERGPEADDSALVDIIVEGDAIAAAIAQSEIENIANRGSGNASMRLRDIPPELYPFLAGPRNENLPSLVQGRDVDIQVPHYYTWSHQPPPQVASPADVPTFAPHPTQHIQLSGDRRHVQDVKAELERRAELLRQQIALSEVPISRGQHQFVAGQNGESLHDLLRETGCTFIIPPSGDDTEMITIAGPRDRLDAGMDKVMNLATSMQMSSVDISRQHPTAPLGAHTHARTLTRYLQQRRAIRELERLHASHINLPTSADAPATWEVYSREGRNTIKARSDILNLVNAHPPTRFSYLEINPFFHPHIQQDYRQRLRDDHGVHVLLPEDVDDTQVVLIFEGVSAQQPAQLPRQKPTPAEIAQFQQGLAAATQQLNSILNGQRDIRTVPVEVPSKYREKARRFVQREQAARPPNTFAIQFLPLATSENEDGSSSNVYIPVDQQCFLRGPEDRLADLAQKVADFIEAEKRDEVERGHITTFDFPSKFSNHLIGRRGENVNKLRDEFDVEIQIRDGTVELKGPKAKAAACKSHILAMGRKLEDETTHRIRVDPQFHRDLIGNKGSQVNRLQDRYKVRIQFPRSAQNGNDDGSVDGSDVGTSRPARPLDEIMIRGTKRGADEARDELLSLAKYLIDNSHTATIKVARAQLPSLIGTGGRNMDNIRQETGAQILIPQIPASGEGPARVDLKVKGTKKQVDEARKLLEQSAKVFDDTVVREVTVNKKYHKGLIGTGGSTIKNIVVAAGGSDDSRELARMVRFPRQDSDDTVIRVEGPSAIVDKVVSGINAFATERAEETTDIIDVPSDKHRMLIGPGGQTRRQLEQKLGVQIDIPKQGSDGPARTHVKLIGKAANIAKAKEHINDLVASQQGVVVNVPRSLHHAVADNGNFFRRLRRDYEVTVDHNGKQPPRRTAAESSGGTPASSSAHMPLITDESDSSAVDSHSWSMATRSGDDPSTAEAGTIPWVLRGPTEGVASAQAALQKALDKAQAPSFTGYLTLADPSRHRHIIGPGGATINAIRKESGCKIQVPRGENGSGPAPIEIVGGSSGAEGVELARDLILEAVRAGSNRRRDRD